MQRNEFPPHRPGRTPPPCSLTRFWCTLPCRSCRRGTGHRRRSAGEYAGGFVRLSEAEFQALLKRGHVQEVQRHQGISRSHEPTVSPGDVRHASPATRTRSGKAGVLRQGKPEAFLGHPGGLQADKCEISLVLPWPPSINHYWVHVGTRRVVSTDGRLYRRQAVAAIHSQWPSDVPRPLAGRLAVTLRLYASTRHDYDIDNRIKVTLDCLQRARAMQNDNQIDALHVYRERLTTGGRVDVWLMVC